MCEKECDDKMKLASHIYMETLAIQETPMKIHVSTRGVDPLNCLFNLQKIILHEIKP
jgi:hypothetical protein